ncbi:MAG: general secretion pathway protein GspB [Candidatus Omnitrophica bacterium]|nr:general secretion pathway protein GspB [Candidatus Omnitrophota bacterium]
MGYCQRIGFFLAFLILFSSPLRAEKEFIYPPDLERDPFEPLINKEGIINLRLVRGVGDLKLNGIIYSSEREHRTAIINNELFKEGDMINFYRIEQINSNSVVVSGKGKRIILKTEEENEE